MLDIATESERAIIDTNLHLWAPGLDTGLEYMVAHVNDKEKTVDHGGLYGIQNLGPGHVFVDVGSCLGTTSLAISLLYPGTRIVSIEAAGPNWLMQEMNWRCNADELPTPPHAVLLGGVGPAHEATVFAEMLWRGSQVTATRSWTPTSERQETDRDIPVQLEPWHALLVQAEIANQRVDVLNVDCAACEYNLIPAMTDKEFNSINTVMGGLHWGYIPRSKLPSSKRAKETHQRLCQHENFARTAKECCQFPDLPVISSFPGEAIVQDNNKYKSGTVIDVAGELCDDFHAWAIEKHVFDIDNDFGWFQITSTAD